MRRQGGRCAACGALPGTRRLHVDHSHAHTALSAQCDTLAPGGCRGLLCWTCNKTLGAAKDSIDRLECLALYLKRGWEIAVAHRDCRESLRYR